MLFVLQRHSSRRLVLRLLQRKLQVALLRQQHLGVLHADNGAGQEKGGGREEGSTAQTPQRCGCNTAQATAWQAASRRLTSTAAARAFSSTS